MSETMEPQAAEALGGALIAIRLHLHGLAATRRAMAREAAESTAIMKRHDAIEAEERRLIGILAMHADADVIAAAAAL